MNGLLRSTRSNQPCTVSLPCTGPESHVKLIFKQTDIPEEIEEAKPVLCVANSSIGRRGGLFACPRLLSQEVSNVTVSP